MKIDILTVAYGCILVGGAVLALQGRPSPTPQTPPLRTPGLYAKPGSSAGIPLLTTASIELPTEERAFPEGPGVEVANQNCTSCHSPGMVLNQPLLTSSVWEEEVKKMRATYHAPVAEADVPAIVAYLTAIKGTE